MTEARQTPAREKGFTLLEVVVALAILGLSLGVLFGIFSQSVARTHANTMRENERLLAATLLQQALRPDHIPADNSGRTDNGLVWQLRAFPFGSEDDTHNWPESAIKVVVTVSRSDQPGDHVTLSTLRLGPKERVE